MTGQAVSNSAKPSLGRRRNSREVSINLQSCNSLPLDERKGNDSLANTSERQRSGNPESEPKSSIAGDPFSRASSDDETDTLSAASTPNCENVPGRLRWRKSDEVFLVAEGMKLKQLDGRTVLPILEDRLYFQAAGFEPTSRGSGIVHYFTLEKGMQYESFCADFGPFNLGMIHRFCESLKGLLLNPRLSKSKLIFYCKTAQADVTNAIFLLGAFLCVHLKATPAEAWMPFSKIDKSPCLPYRDCTWVTPSTYDLHIKDCWAGLVRATKTELYNPGEFNREEYVYYDNPKHGDMHEVVKNKFFAFKGPTSERVQIKPGLFSFLPSDYCHVFRYKGVRTVVRLNDAEYDREDLVALGFHHHDLIFGDCTAPSDAIVDKFLRIAESSEGGIAVHCYAGLGRTGTLVAMWMMKHLQFTCSEAIAWLRICRPGSVIGPQQHYLQAQEQRMHALGRQQVSGLGLAEGTASEESAGHSEKGSAAQAKELAAMVSRGMAERETARIGGCRVPHRGASERDPAASVEAPAAERQPAGATKANQTEKTGTWRGMGGESALTPPSTLVKGRRVLRRGVSDSELQVAAVGHGRRKGKPKLRKAESDPCILLIKEKAPKGKKPRRAVNSACIGSQAAHVPRDSLQFEGWGEPKLLPSISIRRAQSSDDVSYAMTKGWNAPAGGCAPSER